MLVLSLGGIAQLGERLNGIQKVSGSIPLISTNIFNPPHLKTMWLFPLHSPNRYK